MSNSEKLPVKKMLVHTGATEAEKWANGVTDHGVMHLSSIGAAGVSVYIQNSLS